MLPFNSIPTVAILGAGFSGSLVAAHLLKTANRPLVIKLVERRPQPGQGVAYSTPNPRHLLNVSAGNMSAFPEEPGHLLRWLNYNRTALGGFFPEGFDASSFIPRAVFGLYIQSILEEAEASAPSTLRLERIGGGDAPGAGGAGGPGRGAEHHRRSPGAGPGQCSLWGGYR